jgi:hypothetical protein
MVDIRFIRRLRHFVPLGLLQHIARSIPSSLQKAKEVDDEDEHGATIVPSYITSDDAASIAAMQLLSRGRLSVQAVEQAAYDVILRLGEQGHGWHNRAMRNMRSKANMTTSATTPIANGNAKAPDGVKDNSAASGAGEICTAGTSGGGMGVVDPNDENHHEDAEREQRSHETLALQPRLGSETAAVRNRGRLRSNAKRYYRFLSHLRHDATGASDASGAFDWLFAVFRQFRGRWIT